MPGTATGVNYFSTVYFFVPNFGNVNRGLFFFVLFAWDYGWCFFLGGLMVAVNAGVLGKGRKGGLFLVLGGWIKTCLEIPPLLSERREEDIYIYTKRYKM